MTATRETCKPLIDKWVALFGITQRVDFRVVPKSKLKYENGDEGHAIAVWQGTGWEILIRRGEHEDLEWTVVHELVHVATGVSGVVHEPLIDKVSRLMIDMATRLTR